MAFNVYEFRSQMQGDGARPNLFQVEMQFPLFSNPGNASQKLTFFCKTAGLPGSTVNSVPIQYFGREIKVAGNRTFADWTITIINDEDFVIRNAFERWMAALNSHSTNLRNNIATSASSYGADAVVRQYSKAGSEIKSYKFVGMFPTDVSQIDVDWGSNDTIEEFTVTMAYQYWEAAEIGIN